MKVLVAVQLDHLRERGTTLSGGQRSASRSRRALVEDPSPVARRAVVEPRREARELMRFN